MRILVVDDEQPARERLKRLLADIEDVELIGEAEGGPQAVELIEREQPDLVLLDIQMPGLDGFGVIEALEEPPPIVFVTAYDEYAIHAFEVNALDYLLKPFSKERLEQAIAEAEAETVTKPEGKKAPLFTLPASTGGKIALKDFRGDSHVVLYFYPKDMTPGCTTEACHFRDLRGEFEQAGATILGVSADDIASHRKFVAKQALNFPLLSDAGAKVPLECIVHLDRYRP